jgi:hypothetical protein
MTDETASHPSCIAKIYCHLPKGTTHLQILDIQGRVIHGNRELHNLPIHWTLMETVDLQTRDPETALMFAAIWYTMIKEIGGRALTVYTNNRIR